MVAKVVRKNIASIHVCVMRHKTLDKVKLMNEVEVLNEFLGTVND